MRLVYIAGPYRSKTVWGVDQNIQRARALGARVLAEVPGWFPMIPHANTAYFDGLAPDEVFLEGTMEMLRRCDALLLVPGWQRSSGTLAEVEEARRLKIPVFEGSVGLGDLRAFGEAPR